MLELLTKLFGKKFVQSIMGTRTNVQLLKTVRNNPFTQNFSKQALKDDPGMLSEAEAVMQKYAGHALANRNIKESTQFMKNLRTLDEIKNPPKAQVYEFATKKEAPKKVREGIEQVRGGDPDTLQGSMQSMMSLIDEIQGITPTMRVAKNRQELADFIRKMRGKKFSNEQIKMVKDYANEYSINLAKTKLAPAISKTNQLGGKTKAQIELTDDYMDTLKTRNQEDFKDYYTVSQTNYHIREGMLNDLRAQGFSDDIVDAVDNELYQLSYNRTGGFMEGPTVSSHPANWVKQAGEEIEIITGRKFDTKFYENFGDEVLSKYKGEPEFASGGIARVGFAGGSGVKFIGGKIWKDFIEKLFIKASNDIRQGKGKWAGLTQPQWIKQHDDLTKMLKKWEWGGKKGLPKGAEQYIGMNDLQITRAIKGATKKVDDEKLMQTAYDEIKGGSGFSGDYKYDADILAEEYARQHGKVFADLPQDQISKYYDPALKRVQQDLQKDLQIRRAKKIAQKNLADLEQKVELQMFDTKGRKPNASGGIAGELHLNEGGRVSFVKGGKVSSGLANILGV